MADTVEEIQQAYISELRSVAPGLAAWWRQLLARSSDEESVWQRWPTGPSGHPVVLAIFRKHYFAIEALNKAARAEPPDDTVPAVEMMWGTDDLGEARRFLRHADWLIHDIRGVAPDVAELTDGLVFVPVGTDQDEEPV
jgi:hypothetical protein